MGLRVTKGFANWLVGFVSSYYRVVLGSYGVYFRVHPWTTRSGEVQAPRNLELTRPERLKLPESKFVEASQPKGNDTF